MEASEKKTLAPGMTQVCPADETLVVTDQDGNEFAVEGREAEGTMKFLKAFDEWFVAKESMSVTAANTGPVLDALWFAVKESFNALPMRIHQQLPSFAKGGVILRQHEH